MYVEKREKKIGEREGERERERDERKKCKSLGN